MQRSTFVAASRSLDAVHRAVNFVLVLLVIFWLVLFAASFVRQPNLAPIVILHRIGDPLSNRLGEAFPAFKRYVPILLAAICYALILVSDRVFPLIQKNLWGRAPASSAKETELTAAESEEAREALYKQYREIEKALKEAKRQRCTFLSVDVVGSTTMKQGETDIAITSTFRAYEDMLKRTFLANRAWKQAWTPDGVMICFLNHDSAIAAGKTILQNLRAFNARENELKTPFQVRCGANEGEVVIFEDSNLEKLVEHVIDVAGHMQKYANPGTLLVSKELLDSLADKTGFNATGKTVDDYETYEWLPAPA